MGDTLLYDSGDIPKRKGHHRSWMRRGLSSAAYLFRIQAFLPSDTGWWGTQEKLRIALHSSVTRNRWKRYGSGDGDHAAFDLYLDESDAQHLLTAILVALQGKREQ